MNPLPPLLTGLLLLSSLASAQQPPAAPPVTSPPAPELIRTVRALRALTPEDASESRSVRLTGTITYYDPDRFLAFVQDDSGGVYFNCRHLDFRGSETAQLRPGDRVELSGVSDAGSFAPYLNRPPGGFIQVRVLGRSSLPAPVPINPRRLLDPALDALWVEASGVVRQIQRYPNRLMLEITNGTDDFTIALPGEWPANKLPHHLQGSHILARGVFGSLTDDNRRLIRLRLYTPAIHYIEVIDDGAKNAFNFPPLKVSELLQYRAEPASRVHVRGTATAAFPGRALYLRVDGVPLQIITNEPSLPLPGQKVDAVGFPVPSGVTVSLHTPTLRIGPSGPPPTPLPLPVTGPIEARWQGELVQVEARLIDQFRNGEEMIFLASSGAQTFPLRLAAPAGLRLPDLPLQGWFQFTGICLVDQEPYQNPVQPWLQPAAGPIRGFSLLLRGPADLVLLRHPPFWTTGRILAAGSALAFALAMAFLWVFLLRRKVAQQTTVIASQIEAERVGEERARIARELHDTLEQELAGIGLQLDLALSRASQQPERARGAIDLALRMLRRTQQETRRSIQDLRSGLLERTRLGDALRLSIDRLREEQNAPIEADIDDPLPALPVTAEHNLLRIGQEALNNAQQHGRARHIHLTLRSYGGALELGIEDDGAGFDPSASPPGHFGLQGMRERAIKMGATFQIETRPGAGTRITVRLPLSP